MSKILFARSGDNLLTAQINQLNGKLSTSKGLSNFEGLRVRIRKMNFYSVLWISY